MSWDERLIDWLLAGSAFPVFVAVVFAAHWLGMSRLTSRLWIRISAALLGTLLITLIVFLIAWDQASGS